MIMFVLALRVYQLTGSTAAVSGLYLTFGIPAFVVGMAAGAIVDHFDKRTVLLICDITRAVICLFMLFFTRNIYFVYLLAFGLSLVTQFYAPAEGSSIPRFVPGEHLVTANSLFSFTFYGSFAFGSMLAGPALRWFGPYGVLIMISVLFLVAAVFEACIPPEVGKRRLSILSLPPIGYIAKRVTVSVREGIAYVSKSRALIDALFLLSGTQIILGLLAILGPAFADRMLEIDIRDASLVIIGPVVVGIILGALWVGNSGYKLGSLRLINLGITSAGSILILISITVVLKRFVWAAWLFTNPVILPIEFVLFFLLGVANSMLDVPANSILQSKAEGEMRGRVYGLLTAAVGGAGILPVIISGVLADTIGVGKVILLLGTLVAFYGLFRVKYNKT